MKIIVGVDGSPSSARAVEWCAAHAAALQAEVVAVDSIQMPLYREYLRIHHAATALRTRP
jgi:nucleotide-binding universal stress UspA family protein